MRVDNKIVLGIAFFFGILLLSGWIAINEEGRMSEFGQQFEARSLERGATIFESNCSTCHGAQGQGIPGRAPALNNPRLFNGERLEEMGWTGTLEDYVANAVAGGRPNSGSYWNGNVMPTWGQEFGGPLRPDQVQNVADFVLNWESSALDEENPPIVLQDFVLPGGEVVAGEDGGGEAESDVDVAAILENLPEGNSSSGANVYASLGCVGCHQGGAIAPATIGTWDRVQDRIATTPELDGYAPDEYIIESILAPNAYIVVDSPSYVDPNGNSLMPGNYSDLLGDQDLADLLAYLQSQ